MSTTPIAGLTEMLANQAAKEETFNQAIYDLEVLAIAPITSRTLTIPPSLPTEDTVYIVASGSSGAWLGQTDKIAYYRDSSWRFLTPRLGYDYWSIGDNNAIIYTASGWNVRAGGGDMSKSIYDNDDDGIINISAGGTGVDLSSSNGYIYANSGTCIAIKANLTASGVPTVNDDVTQGYDIGSIWLYNQRKYTCYNPASGNALWKTPLASGDILPAHEIRYSGVPLIQRVGLNFEGNVTVTDDSGNNATVITINSSGGNSLTWSEETGNFTAVVNHGYFLNPTTSLTITLPVTPNTGDIVAMCLIGGNSTTAATIGLNSQKFQGWASNRILRLNQAKGTVITFTYINSTFGWSCDQTLINNGVVISSLWDKFVSFWNFDERSNSNGIERSDSINTNNLSDSGGVPSSIQSVNGIKRNTANFDGTADYLFITDGNQSGLDISQNLSIVTGVILKSVSGFANPRIISKGNTSTDRSYSINHDQTNNRFTFIVSGDGTAITTLNSTLTPLTINTPYFLHAQYDYSNSLLSLNINQGTPNTTAFSGNLYNSGQAFTVGTSNVGGTVFFNGYIGFVGVSNQLFTTDELNELYNNGQWLKFPHIIR